MLTAFMLFQLAMVCVAGTFLVLSWRAMGRAESIKRQWEKEHRRPWGT